MIKNNFKKLYKLIKIIIYYLTIDYSINQKISLLFTCESFYKKSFY